MRCPQCGAPLDDRAKFCPRCGEKLEGANTRAMSTVFRNRQTDHVDAGDVDGGRSRQSANARRAESSDRLSAASKLPRERVSEAPDASASAQTRKRRHRFIALVLGVAIMLVAGYLLWDVHMRPYSLNAKDFPSAGVRAAVAATADVDRDGFISRDEATAVESLTITEGDKIYGFEVFPNLKTLIVDSDETISVDVSTAPQLQSLEALRAPNLSEVALKGNTSLKTLSLKQTEITALDVSQAPHIETLSLTGTPLKSIDVSGLKNLVVLNLIDTGVERVDVAGLSALSCMTCDNSVVIDNLSDTSLKPYWVVVEFQNNVPEFGPLPRQRVQMEAMYDEFNRLESVRYEEVGELTLTPATVSYEYDDAGHVVQATFENMRDSANGLVDCTWTLTYDNRGNLVESSNDAGCTCAYEYDSSNRLVTYVMNAPSGAIERYTFTYNQAGYLASMTHNGREKTLLSYNAAGQLTDATVIALSGGFASRTPSAEGEDSSREDARDAGSSNSSALGSRTTDESDSSSSSSNDADAAASDGANASNDRAAEPSAQSPESILEATDAVASYTYRYDSDGRRIRFDYVSFKGSGVSYTETYTYAADGSLLNAQRNSKSGDASESYLYHDITSARYGYASDGSLTSVSLTRADQSDGAHETYALKYQVMYAATGYVPVGVIWQAGDPLASMVDDGVPLATAVFNGQSYLTPWARLPQMRDIAFNRTVALPGASL